MTSVSSAALGHDRGTQKISAADGVELVLHQWRPRTTTRAVLFYIHGIQSHSGWLFESGPNLADKGVLVASLDRRGSGTSAGVRGHLPTADIVLDDYARAFQSVVGTRREVPITALGQSFGGSVLAALGVREMIEPHRYIFCAPALGQQRSRHDASWLAGIRQDRSTNLSPLGFADSQYTDQPEYLRWIANDGLMLRQVSAGTRAAMVDLEEEYISSSSRLPKALIVQPEHDTIIDSSAALATLREIANDVEVVSFPSKTHYLEFSSQRDAYLELVASRALQKAG